MNVIRYHSPVISPEIICMQEKEHPTAGLVPYPALLLFIGGFG
jgi:hypothetical protein